MDVDKQGESLVTPDEHHNSPTARIVLVSKDQIAFRVDEWYMKKKSALVNDTLSMPAPSKSDDIVLEVPARSDVVRTFVDGVMVTSWTPSESSVKDIDKVAELLSLCDYLDASEISTAVRTRLCVSMRKLEPDSLNRHQPLDVEQATVRGGLRYRAWRVFSLAAQRHDVELAKAAIRRFELDGLSQDAFFSAPAKLFEAVPGPWVAALWLVAYELKIQFKGSGRRYTEFRYWKRRGWTEIADDFKL